MKQFDVEVPVYLNVRLEAPSKEVAALRGLAAVDHLVTHADPLSYELEGYGPLTFGLLLLDEEEDDTPDVFAV